jgi:hypothetical protein
MCIHKRIALILRLPKFNWVFIEIRYFRKNMNVYTDLAITAPITGSEEYQGVANSAAAYAFAIVKFPDRGVRRENRGCRLTTPAPAMGGVHS